MQTDNANLKGTTEIKQAFLASAISDISSYIQLSDTKVSIIMAAMVALVAAVVSCYEPILCALDKIKPCSWVGVAIVIFSTLFFISFVAVFVFGILTIRGHSSNIGYKSKWFLPQTTKEYSFEVYKKDLPIINYTEALQKEFITNYNNTYSNSSVGNVMDEWNNYLEEFKSNLVAEENFEILQEIE